MLANLGKLPTFSEKNSHYRYNPSVSILLISWKASEPCSYNYIVSNFDSINGVHGQADSKSQTAKKSPLLTIIKLEPE